MDFRPKDPPRRFPVGVAGDITLAHVADLELAPDEMVTFTTPRGGEYDLTAKDWGYYATPSLGGRLRRFGYRAALMRNRETRHCFVVLVDETRLDAFRAYLDAEGLEVVEWLDDFDRLATRPASG